MKSKLNQYVLLSTAYNSVTVTVNVTNSDLGASNSQFHITGIAD